MQAMVNEPAQLKHQLSSTHRPATGAGQPEFLLGQLAEDTNSLAAAWPMRAKAHDPNERTCQVSDGPPEDHPAIFRFAPGSDGIS